MTTPPNGTQRCGFCGRAHDRAHRLLGSLGAEWERYMELRLPPGLSTMGKLEARRAFYAGASLVFAYMDDARRCEGAEPTEESIERLARMREEAIQFGQWVVKGIM